MWTLAVASLCYVAVIAEHLQIVWEIVLNYPAGKLVATHSFSVYLVLMSVIVDMVDCQKFTSCLAAASAFSAIMVEYLLASFNPFFFVVCVLLVVIQPVALCSSLLRSVIEFPEFARACISLAS